MPRTTHATWRSEPPGLFAAGRQDVDYWTRVKKTSKAACALAGRHYSRRKPGSGQFMPPGQTIVLLAPGAVFGWWRPGPASGIRSMNGLDGWTCTIFRNESPVLSSTLILAAEPAMTEFGYGIGPDGLLTYVWDKKVRSSNPGRVRGRSADGRKPLLHKAAVPP